MEKYRSMLLFFALVWTGIRLAHGAETMVEKKVFRLATYTTTGGQTIKDVKVGYETYGQLNAARDNVILIAHQFLGTSHAAGKYKPDDAEPGYWDAIIGSGKPIDTDKYFVISSDSLANSNAKDPTVVTTGPSSINSETGRPYGVSFPIVTVADFARVQVALVKSLGVTKLRAVGGFSMGAMQAYEWAADNPDMVDRIFAVAGTAQTDAYLIGMLNAWAAPVLLDRDWNNGDYYRGPGPIQGVNTAMKSVILSAAHPIWADSNFGRKWAAADRDPNTKLSHRYLFETSLDGMAGAFGSQVDANSYLYSIKALQLFTVGQASTVEEGLKRVRAKVLLVPIHSDLLVREALMKRDADILTAQGVSVRWAPIDGGFGHLEGRFGIAKAGDSIREFLDQ